MTEDSGGHSVKAWPAIVDLEDAVGLRVFDTAEEAAMEHHHGVLRLLTLQLSGKLRDLRRQHGLNRAALLGWSAAGSPEALIDSLVQSSLLLAAGNQPVGIRDEAAFKALRESVRTRLGLIFRKQAGYLNKTLAIWSEISKKLDDAYYNRRPEVFNEMRAQLDDMVYEGFLQELSPARLEHYPRYLEAMSVRLQSVEEDPHRDAVRMKEVEPFWRQYLELLEQGRDYDEAVDEYRWLLEEFRVSLFAQQLGTRAKVSVKRLRQAWQKIG
jgi:ATP-dependent helicase HrpA